MSAPFDTLQLARGFEAAGFPLDQASKMAEAVAQATVSADLATKADVAALAATTKTDLRDLEQRLTIRLSAAMVVVAGLLFGALHYWPPTTAPSISAPAQRTSVGSIGSGDIVLAAAERPYSCRLLDDAERACAFGQCDQRERERLRKECLRDGGRP
jgi:hypothetical protein